jgi:hypothetical protein
MESIEVEEVLEALESLILDSQMRSKAVIG